MLLHKAIYVFRNIVTKIKCRKRIHIPYNTKIERFTRISTFWGGTISLGKSAWIDDSVVLSAVFEGRLEIGSHVQIRKNAVIVSRKKITIGDYTGISHNVCIFDHDHRFGKEGRKDGYSVGDISIGNHCWIGANVTILRGTTIGDGCVIGAGCIIKGNIPPHSIVKSNRELIIEEIREK